MNSARRCRRCAHDKVDIKLSDEDRRTIDQAADSIRHRSSLCSPGAYTIKFLARDAMETGRIGTYINKFVVPNLNKEDKRVAISSVILSGQRIELKDTIYTAGKSKVPDVSPLIQDGQKLMPSVTRVFSKNRDMYVYLQAYEPNAPAIQPLVAFVTFYKGQVKAFETAPLPVTEGINNRLKTVPLRFSLALGNLPTGKYNCQVTVISTLRVRRPHSGKRR